MDVSQDETCPLNRYQCKSAKIDQNSKRSHLLSETHQTSLIQFINEESNVSTRPSSKTKKSSKSHRDRSLVYEKELFHATNQLIKVEDELIAQKTNLSPSQYQQSLVDKVLKNVTTALQSQESDLRAMDLNRSLISVSLNSIKEIYSDIRSTGRLISGTGIHVWRIDNIREKMIDAESERQTSVYSPSFYTSSSGYKVRVRLYLNGDGAARGTHISIFLVILRGEFDEILQWPFTYRVAFCLCDQRTILESNGTRQPQNIIESFRPDVKSRSFEKPRSYMNIASGIPRFYELSKIDRSTDNNLYLINDVMFIKIWIDFVGIKRELLSSIFDIDMSLPSHIQEEMINKIIINNGSATE